MRLNYAIIRSYSTQLARNALTFSKRQTLNSTESSVSEPAFYFKDDTSESHVSMFPYYVRDGIPRQEDKELNEVVKRFDRVCYHTGPERELYSSFVLLSFYKTLELPHRLNSESLKLASILAWCFEFIAAGFMIEDDIMDNNKMRWKKVCLHEQKGIGLTVLTDSQKLYASPFRVLKKHFKNHPFYVQLMDVLRQTVQVTALGQSLDVNTDYEFKRSRKLDIFSFKKYESIAKLKSGFILYKGPPTAAMYLAHISDKELMNIFLRIADKFTIYRQAQDDVWDVYSDLDFFGKVGNDMSNGKCTWLIVTAMQHANKQQLEILQEHYGKEDFESINMILEVYKEIDVVNKFLEYKYRLIDELKKEIATLSLKPLRDLCYAHIDEYIDIEENFLDYNAAIKTQKQV